jgi:hypothetical protein
MALRPDLATGLPFSDGWGELGLSSRRETKGGDKKSLNSTGKGLELKYAYANASVKSRCQKATDLGGVVAIRHDSENRDRLTSAGWRHFCHRASSKCARFFRSFWCRCAKLSAMGFAHL